MVLLRGTEPGGRIRSDARVWPQIRPGKRFEQAKGVARPMASIRVTRSMRGVAATLVVAAVSVPFSPASADPPPPANSSDAARQLHDLSGQAEELTEQYKKTQDDHAAKRDEHARANATADQAAQTAAAARADEDRSRGAVDQMSHSSYEGARLNTLSALLTSKNPNEFLDRSSTMEILARDNNRSIQQFSTARAQADEADGVARDARDRSAAAEADAARIEADMGQRKAAMDAQVAKVQQLYNSMSKSEKDALAGGANAAPHAAPVAGAGAAVTAVNAALSKQGSPYVYGATGPNSFDCSGLVQWSYKQAGISLPRATYSQQTVGSSVSQSDLRPGDLMFFNGGGHVGIYIGDGKVVHAPTEGETVKVTAYQYLGGVNGIRRVAG